MGSLIGSFVAWACTGGDAPDTADVVVRDSAGLRVVENNARAWRDDRGWNIDPEPVLQIGAVEGEDAYLFTSIRHATRRDDGVIAVTDMNVNEVRIFGPDGAYVHTIGREGEGPGEFTYTPEIVWVSPDTLLTWDPRLRRLTWFDDAAGVVREKSMLEVVSAPEIPGVHGINGIWSVLSDGALLVIGNAMEVDGVGSHAVRLFSPQGSVTSFGDYDGTERINVNYFLVSHPFTPYPHSVVRSRPFAVFVVRSGRREITAFDADGNVTEMLRIGVPRIPIGEEILEAERDELRRIAETARKPPSDYLDAFERLSFPDSLPAVESLLVDARGNLWVGRMHDGRAAPVAFDVLDVEGRWLGTVRVPEDANRIYEVGDDYLLAGWRDAADVSYLRMYRILK